MIFLNEIELKILIGLHRNVNAIDKKTFKLAKDYGLSFSQFMVLEALYSKGDMTIGEVRDKILSSVGTISLIVKNLEKMNYIKRLSDEKDARVCILSLTEEGRKLVGKVAPENEKMIIESMEVLNEDEKKQMVYLLKKLGGIIDEKTSKD